MGQGKLDCFKLQEIKVNAEAKKELKEYLDDCIERWRHIHQTDPDKNVVSTHYIDAFQSVRVSMLGELKE